MINNRIVGNAKTKFDMAVEMDYMLRKMGRSAHWRYSYDAYLKAEIKERYLSILSEFNKFN